MKLFIIFYILFAYDIYSFKYSFKNYSNSQGLPQSQIISIAQDSIGRIWVSTHCGIAYYDGYRFETINKKMGLPTNYVYNIEFKDNKIYGAGSNSIFNINILGKRGIEFIEIPYVVRNFIISDKQIIFASDEGLFISEKDGLKKIFSIPPSDGKDVLMKKDDFHYYLTRNAFYKIKKDFTTEKIFSSDLNLKTFCLYKDGILLGAENGLYFYQNEILKKIQDLPPVQDILTDKDDIWVATNDGLYIFQGKDVLHIDKANGLPSNEIYCLFKDREGIFWIGSDCGLSKLQSLAFENYVSEKDLFSGSIWAFYELSEKELLLGGDKGLGIIIGSTLTEIDLNELKGDPVSSITSYKGQLLLAFKNKGIYSISLKDGIKLKKFIKDELSGIFSIYSDMKDNLWICTRNGLYKYHKNKIDSYNKEKGLPDDTVFKIVEDPEGQVLALTDNGIARYEENKFVIPRKYNFLINNSIRSILFDKEKIWVATLGNGLYYFDGTNWTNITEEKGLPSDNLWSMEKDDLGFLWIGSSRGIIMYAEGYSCLFNSNDGLKGDEVTLSGSLKTKDGKIWFGLVSGALKLNPYKIEPNLNPPNLYIEKVESETKIFSIDEEINLKPSNKRISIYFNGLSFQDETEIFYSYRLYPLEEWSQPTQERMVTYTNLNAGHYTFEVKACNASWIWNDNPVKLIINKKPYFFEEISFKLLVLSLFLFLFYFFYKLRTRSIQRDKEKLERIVNDKTKELQERLKELYVMSTTDFLTKVFNRGHFEKLLQEEIKRAKKENATFGLAILDLDHFKDLNDEFGHSKGDEVLVEFGKILRNSFRMSDVVARYGGDEFVILFTSTEPEGCIARLKGLMKDIKGFVYESEDKKIQLSLSIGVVFITFAENKVLDIQSITKKADKAMYEAKSKGRDSIVIYHL